MKAFIKYFILLISTSVLSANGTSLYKCYLYSINCRCDDVTDAVDCSNLGWNHKFDRFLTSFTDSRVKVLNLANNDFTDLSSLPAKFPNLQVLNLSGNSLTDLPDFSEWNELKILDLSVNNFPGNKSLDNLTRIKKLEILYLSNNSLTDLSCLRSESLRELYVDGCKITELRNNSLEGLPNLITLKLSENPLRLIDHPKHKMLIFLDVSSCGLENLNPGSFRDLTNLLYLDVSKNSVEVTRIIDLSPSLRIVVTSNRTFGLFTGIRTLRNLIFSKTRGLEYSLENQASGLKFFFRYIERHLPVNPKNTSNENHLTENEDLNKLSKIYTCLFEFGNSTCHETSSQKTCQSCQVTRNSLKIAVCIIMFVATCCVLFCVIYQLRKNQNPPWSTSVNHPEPQSCPECPTAPTMEISIKNLHPGYRINSDGLPSYEDISHELPSYEEARYSCNHAATTACPGK